MARPISLMIDGAVEGYGSRQVVHRSEQPRVQCPSTDMARLRAKQIYQRHVNRLSAFLL